MSVCLFLSPSVRTSCVTLRSSAKLSTVVVKIEKKNRNGRTIFFFVANFHNNKFMKTCLAVLEFIMRTEGLNEKKPSGGLETRRRVNQIYFSHRNIPTIIQKTKKKLH
jgi:hypothetical protein